MTINKAHAEKRETERQLIDQKIIINSGEPYRGGRLHDISTTGAGVKYLRQPKSTDTPIDEAGMLELRFEERRGFVGHVVWQTNDGFGMKFKRTGEENE